MKKIFVYLIFLSVLILPGVVFAQEVDCTCVGSVNLTQTVCQQTFGCAWSAPECACTLGGRVPESDCNEAGMLEVYGMESLIGQTNLSCSSTPVEPPAPTTPETPEQHVGLGEAQTALDKFLGGSEIKGELIEGDVPTVVGNILRAFLGIVGSVALVIFIYGGIKWMTSGGNPDKLKSARNTVIWSVLGLVVIIASYSIVSAVISGISHKSTILQEQKQQTSECLDECGFTYDEELIDCKPGIAEDPEACEQAAAERLRACRAECREAFQ